MLPLTFSIVHGSSMEAKQKQKVKRWTLTYELRGEVEGGRGRREYGRDGEWKRRGNGEEGERKRDNEEGGG